MEPKLFLDIDGCVFVEQKIDGYIEYVFDGKSFWYAPYTKKRLQAVDVLYDIYLASHHWRGHEEKLSELFEIDTKWKRMTYDGPSPENEMRPDKLREIASIYDGPAAIVDDKMGSAVEEFAKDKTCLLIQPDASVGLTEDAFNLLMSFGELHGDELVKSFMEAETGGLVFSNGEWF